MTDCTDGVTSYNTFLHPMPCAQLLTREIRLPYGTSTDAQIYFGYFPTSFDTYSECMESWIATTAHSWLPAYLEHPEWMGLLFTFTWTHSMSSWPPTRRRPQIGALLDSATRCVACFLVCSLQKPRTLDKDPPSE